MPVNGTYGTILEKVDNKGKGKMSAITSALSDANNSAKKADPKKSK